MGHVLIIDSDLKHAAELAHALHRIGLHVSVFRDRRMAVEALRKESADLVVIMFDSPSWWRNDLKSFCDAIRSGECVLEIVCVLRWPPNGPDDRLYGDQLKVEVLHER